ncbi:hypothetical protein RD110_11990 [Rhodoferax koreense]|uniref:Uncharacterized protein n=1 Tax=Rhodoferax koreensis TaxID=1842727 RepID=A0A1P8JVP6_9BURK|nr:DUF4286 family protein [Rhodoferax koreense]APW37830.1 hypothetical protein RD110_11990 [Rhodoferax koreense]
MRLTTRRPAAFLALWNGIASPALQPEYEAWHTFEHVPERVGLPGFIEARRYRAWSVDDAGAPLYFTCYWLDDLAALDSPAYREVFATPTPWSARMRTQLRAFFRQPCRLAGSHGTSTASQLCTLRLHGDPQAIASLLSAELQRLVDAAQVVSAQWGMAAPPGFEIPIANSGPASATPPGAEPGTEAVVMLQGFDRAPLAASAAALVQALAAVTTLPEPPGFFELLSQVRQDELAHPLTTRQPALMPLFHSFHSGDKP